MTNTAAAAAAKRLPAWITSIHRFAVLYFARLLFTIFRGKGTSVQPTTNDAIFKCSATQLAGKIRRQEVSMSVLIGANYIHQTYFSVLHFDPSDCD